jgi:hypothetical protein
MGWHTRHASTLSGLEGHLRPETLNLTAWNHALGLQQPKKTIHFYLKKNFKLYIFYINMIVYIDIYTSCVNICMCYGYDSYRLVR